MRHLRLLVSFSVLACGTDISEPASDGELRIELPATAFSRAAVQARVIEATVRNTSNRTLFSTARDNFGTTLLADDNSDASVERWDGASWRKVQLGFAIEGIGISRIAPASQVVLWAGMSQAQFPGTFRVRLAFRTDSLGPSSLVAVSQTFTVD